MRKVVPLIIIVLILSIVLVSGCIEDLKKNYNLYNKQLAVPSSIPTPITNSTNGFSSDEQKLTGTWSIKTEVLDGSFTLNSDRSGIFVSPIYGKMYFKWKASNGMLITDAQVPNPLSGSVSYKLINNDKTITIGNAMSFDKSWW